MTNENVQIFDTSIYKSPEYKPFRQQEWPRPREEWDRIEHFKGKVDPITLDVVEGGLEAAVDEGEAAVELAGRSTIIREQHDYRASICTVDCNNVTSVSWGASADAVRAHFPLEEIQEGDVFLFNDAYDSHGSITHLPDYCICVPIFHSGRLIAFSMIFGHTEDVGGRSVGSWPTTSTSIFEEGIQIPPVKLYSKGKVQDDIYKIVLRNTRFPDTMQGDLDAFIGACRLIERQVKQLCDRLGADIVEAAMYKLMDRCEEAVRNVILPMFPNGEFIGEDFLDNDGINLEDPVKLKVTLRKDPEKIILDWTGTNPQTEGPLNAPNDGRFLSKWVGSFLAQFAPGTVINEGVTRVFRCELPNGTVLTSEYPAAVINRMQVWFRSFGAYGAALAQAFGGNVVADNNCVQVYGVYGYDEDGKPWLYREVFGGGSGARPYADGTDAVDMVNDAKNLPTEFIEQRYPVVIERVALNLDSGGAGKYRGGMGYVKDIHILTDGNYVTYVDRTAFNCFGVNGGGPGKPGGTWINPGTPNERLVQFCQEGIPVKAGDIIRVTTPGGGGWGDPLERDVEAVRMDVLRQLVSIEIAEIDYGVVVQKQMQGLVTDYIVDEEATRLLREQMRKDRAPLKLINRGQYAEEKREGGKITFDDVFLPIGGNAVPETAGEQQLS
ncbi:hydantoinase B/oxoprolinase family protein [Peribacillus cavernae]|uniref:Hydantoinase B/oxoprolinase family protein n=1 Tax=Peribacillus cavernae TaxID=1674310 RepID=A0A3S0TY50_9BACI|nr:hydantoinase B/oxoprolinase family protein [Peribacillus cavernae]MDQ0219558.1 N-methylhydantoinase B [Peribacillus cavernae]RUQ27035.1 hydantoinase B/oxoprolinase family protein [Peribacillus cavernae]